MTLSATSSSGRKYPIGQEYEPPPVDICEFLIETFPQLGDHENLESQDMAKRLIDLYEGAGKRRFNSNNVADALPWMYQAGLLDFEQRWHPKGGYRLYLWRSTGPTRVKKVLTERPIILNGEALENATPAASAPSAPPPPEVKPPTSSGKKKAKKKASGKKKKCCDDPKIVKSKKTGKRRCKNCGRKLKAKKKP